MASKTSKTDEEFKLDMTKHTHRMRANISLERSKHNIHPNSLLSKAMKDKELMRKYRKWEREFYGRHAALEDWYAGGRCGNFGG